MGQVTRCLAGELTDRLMHDLVDAAKIPARGCGRLAGTIQAPHGGDKPEVVIDQHVVVQGADSGKLAKFF
jgi:hypothetical protein